MSDANIYSMTGYGRGDATGYGRRFIVELKSVNHRYNEVSVRLPRTLLEYEDGIRKQLAQVITRGKTDVFVTLESAAFDDVSVCLNRPLLNAYLSALDEIKQEADINDSPSLSLVARFPDVLTVTKQTLTEESGGQIGEVLTMAVQEALSGISDMRRREGAALKADILVKLDDIESCADKVIDRAPSVAEDYEKRLREKIQTALEGASYDAARFTTEITIFADKTCIDEELTRLGSHISQMRDILAQGGAVGRKLDFLSQEMNREINTIASKSNDIEITKLSVDMKSELEKIREQIQNIE